MMYTDYEINMVADIYGNCDEYAMWNTEYLEDRYPTEIRQSIDEGFEES